MDKKHQKCPKTGVFPHLRPPKIFFQKSGSVTFVPLWCTNFLQKIRKILRAVSEIFKDGPRTTDGRTDHWPRTMDHWPRTTDIGDYIGPLRINWGPISIQPIPFCFAGVIAQNYSPGTFGIRNNYSFWEISTPSFFYITCFIAIDFYK